MGMRRPDFSRRVAVTGLGIISPIGQDKDAVWDSLVNGRSGLKRITRWDPTPVRGADLGRGQRLRRHAVDGLQGHPPHRPQRGHGRRVGQAGARRLRSGDHRRQPRRHRRHLRLRRRRAVPADGEPARSGRRAARARCSPFFIANMLPDTASGQIAIETGIRGSNMCIVTACSTGTHNIGEAAEGIRRGDYIAALAGSTENPLHEMVYIGFSNMRGMGMPRPGEPMRDRLAAVRQDARRLRARRGLRRDDARGPRVRQGARRARSTRRSSATAQLRTRGTSSSRSTRATARAARWSRRWSGTTCRPTRWT